VIGAFLGGALAAGSLVYFFMGGAERKVVSTASTEGADKKAPAERGFAVEKRPEAEPDVVAKKPATSPPETSVKEDVAAEAELLPVKATAGQGFTCALPNANRNEKYQFLAGPAGMSVTSQGRVQWTPPANASGLQEFAVNVMAGETTTVRRYKIDVAPSAMGSVPGRDRPTANRGRPAPGGLQSGDVLPEKAVSGKAFAYQLPTDAGQKYELMRGPAGMTVTADGKLSWTPGPGPARTESVTLRTSASGVFLCRIEVVEDSGSSLALGKPGGWLMLPDGVTLVAALPDQGRLSFIDTVEFKETRHVDVPFKPGVVAQQGKQLFVAVQGAAMVHVIDVDSGAVTKDIKIPEGTVSDMVCHREKGLVFATTSSKRIVAIEPESGVAKATRARGMFLAIDPVKGDTLYSVIQPEIQDVLVIKELSNGRIALTAGVEGSRALLAKMAVKSKTLEVIAVNSNASTNGYLGRISPDGKRVAVVGGGGYRAAPGQRGTFPTYGVALFDSADIKSPQGVVEVGAYPQDLAFHPVLPMGAARQSGLENALHVFNSQSLIRISSIPIGSGRPGQPDLPQVNPTRLLTFAARGTKLVYFDGAGTGTLRAAALQLSDKDREILDKAYAN
jgi:hypothetical protein